MHPKRAIAAACAAAVLTVGASGCGTATKKAINHELKRKGISVNNKDSSVTIKDDSGNALTYGAKKLPAGWPKEVKLPEKTTITLALANNDSSGQHFAATIGSGKSATDLASYFRGELKGAGYKKQTETTASGSGGMNQLVYDNGRWQVQIAVSDTTESDFHSEGEITIEPSEAAVDTGGPSSGNPLSS